MKSVVVHLDAARRCDERVDVAICLALQHGGRLLGSAATGLADLVLRARSNAPDALEVVQLTPTFLQERAEAVAARFTERVRAAGTIAHEVRVAPEAHGPALCRLARTADLVVVSQHERDAIADEVDRDLVQDALAGAGAPVLLVPREGRFPRVGERALIAWKDAPQAARAVRSALPLLRAAASVDAMSMVEDGTATADVQASLDRLRTWLEGHGVAARLHLEPLQDGAGAQIAAAVDRIGADLLVMGAWGHSRLREWVLGGATRHVLATTPVPTLLSH